VRCQALSREGLGTPTVSGSVRLVVTEGDTRIADISSPHLQHIPPKRSYLRNERCQTFKGTVKSFREWARTVDASVRSFGELGKGFQAIRASMIDYTKKSFEDGTRAFEQLAGATSIEQAWEIQSQYAKKAFEAYVAQASKIGEMYVDLARSAYQPVEQAVAKTARKGA
jgi:Phasin protein